MNYGISWTIFAKPQQRKTLSEFIRNHINPTSGEVVNGSQKAELPKCTKVPSLETGINQNTQTILQLIWVSNASQWKTGKTNALASSIETLAIYSEMNERPLRKFCVSVFRQNQEYYIINVHDWGLFPLATAFPGGWDGMRALRGVNAVPASRES